MWILSYIHIFESIKKDLVVNELDKDMVFDRTLWRRLIHVLIRRICERLVAMCVLCFFIASLAYTGQGKEHVNIDIILTSCINVRTWLIVFSFTLLIFENKGCLRKIGFFFHLA
jgi:hypothetical protein